MWYIGVCEKCSSPDLRRSRIRTFGTWAFSFVVIPYRCRVCDHRQLKFRYVKPGIQPEEPMAIAEAEEVEVAAAPEVMEHAEEHAHKAAG